jgi:hypothetical protein
MIFNGNGHGRGRFAGGGYEGTALRRARQVRAQDLQRVRSRDRGAEAFFEQFPQPKLSFAASAPRL